MSVDTVQALRHLIKNHLIDEAWRTRAQLRLDSLTKPAGSLGKLEEVAAQFVLAREEQIPAVRNPAVYVFAGDHGVTSEGVSAYPSEVTSQMVRNFLAGGAAVNVLARASGAEVVVIDVGVASDLCPSLQLIHRKVRLGTRNFVREPAMTEAELQSALEAGFEQGREALAAKRNLVIAGEMGIGNTTAAAAITVALTGATVQQATGAGTGLALKGIARKAAVVEHALEKHFGNSGQAASPLEVLRCVGGLEIAAMTGLILKAASERILVVLDGFISTASAAIAFALVPEIKPFLLAGHRSTEPGHAKLLSYMGLEPLLKLEMRLGEGTGALLAILVIESALKIYNEMATFESAQVSGIRG